MERSHVFEAPDQAGCDRSETLESVAASPELPLFQMSGAAADMMSPGEAGRSLTDSTPAYDPRALDIVIATFLLILVFPLMCICTVVVIATSRGPLLYRHSRIGRDGAEFVCLKFRTMVVDADRGIEHILAASASRRDEWQALHKLSRDPRVTPVGAFMRRYCLDELPQLFNVLAGQMSIVGPRPIVAAEIEKYGRDFQAYCSVKPGLTGLWQVSGRHKLSYPQRVELDSRYARSRTLSLDVEILLRTVPIVVLGLNE